MAVRLRQSTRSVLLAAVLLAVAPSMAEAKSFAPTRHDDPNPGACKQQDCSLREAIKAANAHPGADTILLQPRTTYNLSILGRDEDGNATGDLDVTGRLTIASSGRRRATIDANRVDRVLDAHAPLTVARLVIRGGETTSGTQNQCGCGIEADAALTVDGSKIVDNHIDPADSAGTGGGIHKGGPGDLTVRHTRVAGNTVKLAGGGIDDESFATSRVTISHSTIAGNVASHGGGFNEFGDNVPATISHSTIARNHARNLASPAEGGGIWIVVNRLRLVDSQLLNNTSAEVGGGLFSRKNRVLIERSTIAGNRARGPGSFGLAGGGLTNIANGADATTIIGSSTISGNRAQFNGGGIENYADGGATARLVVVNSTVAGNSATDFAGGIDSFTQTGGIESVHLNAVTVAFNDADSDGNSSGAGGGLQNGSGSGSFQVKNSLIARNSAPSGPDCSGFAFASEGHNLLGQDTDCLGFTAASDIIRPAPLISHLADNGGPTRTVALRPGSPAIGRAGSDAPKRDQRGVLRHDPDSGAFERR